MLYVFFINLVKLVIKNSKQQLFFDPGSIVLFVRELRNKIEYTGGQPPCVHARVLV